MGAVILAGSDAVSSAHPAMPESCQISGPARGGSANPRHNSSAKPSPPHSVMTSAASTSRAARPTSRLVSMTGQLMTGSG
jgi:hypothetical protein